MLSCKCLGVTKHKVGERTEWKVSEASGHVVTQRARRGREERAVRAQPWRTLVFKRQLPGGGSWADQEEI